MSSNFEFLKSQWPDLYDAAATAEQHTLTDPRTGAFHCRRALELGVKRQLPGRYGETIRWYAITNPMSTVAAKPRGRFAPR